MIIALKSILLEKVLTTILKNKDVALHKLEMEDFDVCLFLNNEFKNSKDITNNYLFQFIFRSYYNFENEEFSSELKTKYFVLLQEYRNKPIDLKTVYLRLNDEKNGKGFNFVPFSFITKLANTIDDNYPIYDSEIIKLFNFNQPDYLKNTDEMIDKYIEQYNYILHTSKELILDHRIKEIFNEMNLLFGESCTKMTNSKKLDTLMRVIGQSI